jgi:transcriptional regulator with XRE-family HTH domain
MKSYQSLGDRLNDKLKDDPSFIAEGLALEIAMQINEALTKKGIQRRELAQRINAKPSYISEILNGTPNMTLLTLSKFAVALDQKITITLTPSDLGEVLSSSRFIEDYDPISSTDKTSTKPKDYANCQKQGYANATPPSSIALAA